MVPVQTNHAPATHRRSFWLPLSLRLCGRHSHLIELMTVLNDNSAIERLSAQVTGLRIVADYPFIGTGPGSVPFLVDKYLFIVEGRQMLLATLQLFLSDHGRKLVFWVRLSSASFWWSSCVPCIPASPPKCRVSRRSPGRPSSVTSASSWTGSAALHIHVLHLVLSCAGFGVATSISVMPHVAIDVASLPRLMGGVAFYLVELTAALGRLPTAHEYSLGFAAIRWRTVSA